MREGYAAFDSGIQAMAGVLNGMLQNMALLSDAVSTLAAQYGVFDTGVNAYTQGVDQILAGTQQLSAASLMLVAGAHQLYTETSSMQLDEELGSLLDTLAAPAPPPPSPRARTPCRPCSSPCRPNPSSPTRPPTPSRPRPKS